MRDFNIDIKIIYKKVEGKLSAEENRLFEEWFQNNAHQEYFKKIQTYYELQHEPSVNKEKTDKAWSRLNKRIKTEKHTHRSLRLTTCIAAASVVLMAASALFWLDKSTTNPESVTASPSKILPGKANAILELADGRSLYLNQLTQENKVQIEKDVQIDSNRLSYKHQIKDKDMTLEFNRISVPRGGEFQLVLSDSTKVWLNSESQLKFPVAFGSEKREIYLEGEAFFEVAKDKQRPFIVYAGAQKVTVLGTSFGITSYPQENYETTTLVEGKVKMEFPQHSDKVYTLTPGYQIRYYREQQKVTLGMVSTDEYVAWKDGKYVFKKKRLEDILTTLSRWYDFQVFYQNNECKEILFSGDIQRFENFSSILNLLKKSSDADFIVTGNTVVVRTNF